MVDYAFCMVYLSLEDKMKQSKRLGILLAMVSSIFIASNLGINIFRAYALMQVGIFLALSSIIVAMPDNEK